MKVGGDALGEVANPVLLTAEAVLPMAGEHRVLREGAVLVKGERVADVGYARDLVQRYPDAEVRDYGRAVLMPGLVNAHCHSGLLRGTAEDLPVWEWLRVYIDPMHRVLCPEEAEIASWLCYAESLLSGTTTVVDMWRYMEGAARAASALGNRLVAVPYVGEAEGYDYFDTLDDNEALIESWHGGAQGRVHVWVGVEHQFYFTEVACQRASDMALRHGVGLHTHSNESQKEIPEVHRRYGLKPIRALEHLGLLEPKHVLLAHCVWLDSEEIAVLEKRGISVVHNPTSNMKLASGASPVDAMRTAGIAVGLGTDGEKENNNLDMFEEMKFASLLGKLSTDDAAASNAWDVLRSATIEGARALGMDDRIGSLETGKQADIIALRADTPRMTPFIPDGEFMNLHHNIVQAAQGGDVEMVMVNGQTVVDGGVLLTGDPSAYAVELERACHDLLARRGAWLKANREGVLSPV